MVKKVRYIATMAILSFMCFWGGNLATITEAEAWSGKMYRGIQGPEVAQLQRALKDLLYTPGPIDGVFGRQTERAVKDFQWKHKLVVTGVADWKTLNEIDRTLAKYGLKIIPPQTAKISRGWNSSRDDVYLLAKAIHAEARGESYEGQVAVGAVILNRVRSSQFPNSVYGVVYQSRQFDAVYDGQINLQPSQTALNAAQDALRGWDPSYGSLFYYNPRYIKDRWILSRPIVKTIGNHVFAK